MGKSHYYKAYPSDYVRALKLSGKRKKASAFMEYFDDNEYDEHHSISFYAKSWGVSKSTAWRWIEEFKIEINKFTVYWDLKNSQKNSSQKTPPKKFSETQTKRLSNGKENFDPPKDTENKGFQENEKTLIERLGNEDNNIYDDEDIGVHFDKDFLDLFFTYRMNYKYAGTKEEAYKEYRKIKKSIDHNQLKNAIIFYLHDPEVQKRYNFKNFLKNAVYYSYMPKRVKIKIRDSWKIGEYDEKNQIFIADDGYRGVLTPERLAELFSKGELEFEQCS